MGKARRTRQTREQERKRARTRRALIATGTAVAVVVALIVMQQVTSSGSSRPDPSNLTGVAEVQTQFSGVDEKAGTISKPGASPDVTITEYGDLRCPGCRQFAANVTPRLIDDFVRTGKAKMRFRTWPILGTNSVTAAQAAYAAQQQNALWRYAMLTYLNQGDETVSWFTPAYARAVAAGVGLDIAKFDHDRASAAADAEIAKVRAEASAAGFAGTPSIRVTGPKGMVTVDNDYDAIASAVQKVSGTAA
jgi:protein-disulfide isomerase